MIELVNTSKIGHNLSEKTTAAQEKAKRERYLQNCIFLIRTNQALIIIQQLINI